MTFNPCLVESTAAVSVRSDSSRLARQSEDIKRSAGGCKTLIFILRNFNRRRVLKAQTVDLFLSTQKSLFKLKYETIKNKNINQND